MITEKDGKICLSCEIIDLRQIFRIKLIEEQNINIIFPLMETVVFDFKNGSTCLEVINGNGELLGVENVTEHLESWRGRATYELLSGHQYMVQCLAEKFQTKWPEKALPFEVEEMKAEYFLYMTKYVGFPRSFYLSLPVTKDKENIDGSFKKTDERIRRVEDVCAILREHKIPSMKVVNRILYTEPALCYYAEELHILWELINNQDIYVRLLQADQVYEVLSFLHDYPHSVQFFEDYIKRKGAKNILKHIEANWREVRLYAVSYSAMSESRRSEEQEKWKKRKNTLCCRLGADYSRPVKSRASDIKDCVMEGYSIVKLKTTHDFLEASEKLQNCLRNWENFVHATVFVIKKDGCFKAAIEVCDNQVITALGFRNEELEYDEETLRIYHKWLRRFNLKEKLKFLDVEPLGLPF